MIYQLAKQILFRLDPETAHELITEQMVKAEEQPLLLSAISRLYRRPTPGVRREVWGLEFGNPLGIAAGFDKDATLVPMLAALGFGFVEVGTVTLRPQPGNPKPRMFRYPEEEAIINRLGFNNLGAPAARGRLEALWKRHGRSLPPLFVNIGKNKDVPLDQAVASYRDCYRLLAPVADAVVVNVSSPNTPGLRDLQKGESLREILDELRNERLKLKAPRGGEHPIIVKIAPDLDERQLSEVAMICLQAAEGMTATNTTIDRTGWSAANEAGGLSGRPLFDRSTEVLRTLRRLVGPEFPLIGVGGVMDGQTARAKLSAGANLIQAYTGFIYGGPAFARHVNRFLNSELRTPNSKL